MNAQDLINEAIEYNGKDGFDEFWQPGDADVIRTGTPGVRVFAKSLGLGWELSYMVALVIELPDGKCASVRDEVIKRVPSRWTRNAGVRDYGLAMARKLYGDLPTQVEWSS